MNVLQAVLQVSCSCFVTIDYNAVCLPRICVCLRGFRMGARPTREANFINREGFLERCETL